MDLRKFFLTHSELWLNHSHKNYTPLNDVKELNDDEELKNMFWEARHLQSLTFSFSSLKRIFWIFQSDSITKKINHIQKNSEKIYTYIKNDKNLLSDYIGYFQRTEVINSIKMEGIHIEDDVADNILSGATTNNNTFAKSALFNTSRALTYSLSELHKNNSILDAIKAINNLIMTSFNTAEVNQALLEFRKQESSFGIFKGTKPELIETALKELNEELENNPRYVHPLIKAITAMYFIMYIRPFHSANNLMARIIFYLWAKKSGLDFLELIPISKWMQSNDAKIERSTTNSILYNGDLTFFIDDVLTAIMQSSEELRLKINYVSSIKKLLQKNGFTDDQIMLLQKCSLNENYPVSTMMYAETTNKSRESARKELKQLVEVELLMEVKDSKKHVHIINHQKFKELMN